MDLFTPSPGFRCGPSWLAHWPKNGSFQKDTKTNDVDIRHWFDHLTKFKQEISSRSLLDCLWQGQSAHEGLCNCWQTDGAGVVLPSYLDKGWETLQDGRLWWTQQSGWLRPWISADRAPVVSISGIIRYSQRWPGPVSIFGLDKCWTGDRGEKIRTVL